MEIDAPKERKKCLRLQVQQISRVDNTVELMTKECADGEVSIEETIKVVLEGLWTQGRISKNSIIHLLNPLYSTATKVYSINNTTGLLVIEPDNLLTCTLVASTLFCERKSWLNNVFLGQAGTNRAMLVGTLVHEVFQYGVKNKIADIKKLSTYLDELLNNANVMMEIYSVELHLRDIRSEALGYIGSVREWIEKYMLAGPPNTLTNDTNKEVKILEIRDIEENIWSTKYGLKGKIDVTGFVRVHDKCSKSSQDRILPLELKTGNPNLSTSHAAQVSLYSMMIEDRYTETNQGLVIYLKDKAAMHNVTLTHSIKRDLVQRRNQINYHLKSHYFGPDMIDQPRVCKNCERLTECVLMSRIYTPGEIDKYPSLKSFEREAIGHLDERFKEFFKENHEKLSSQLTNGDKIDTTGDFFWTQSSEDAEIRGTGFGKLQASITNGDSSNMITFKRHPNHKPNFEVSLVQPNKKVKRVITDFFSAPLPKSKSRPFNVELDFSRTRMAVSFDSPDQTMDGQNSSTAIAIGFLEQLKEDSFVLKLLEGSIDVKKTDIIYRVDKIKKRTNMDVERVVFNRLFEPGNWRADNVRKLILDPDFKPQEDFDLDTTETFRDYDEISALDVTSQDAVIQSLCTENYYILNEKNAPKKINTIVSVIAKVAQQLKKSVLIVAKSTDNLVEVMKLLPSNLFLLIDDRKSKACYQFASNIVKLSTDENKDLNQKYDLYIKQHVNPPVVVTTHSMSALNLLFTRREFHYCVIYDCESTDLFTALSSMFCSDKYILIDRKENSDVSGSKFGSLGNHLRSLRPYN